jgi:tRNA U34 5-methylaminomethyl-2-thiouridine-forming methyltransferase MnmC
MTSSACRPEASGRLEPRRTADGSLTLWSERFGECFHSAAGARAEAAQKFVAPAGLDRFAPGRRLRVLELCVGLGYNTAALLEAAEARGLQLEWLGLELDPRPLQLALGDADFRSHWHDDTLQILEQLNQRGAWRSGRGSSGSWRLGDARRQLPLLPAEWIGRCDLVLHDAFSPGHCPELWSLEVLVALARLLQPDGRLLTYCSAAAVRHTLELAGLQLASIRAAGPAGPDLACPDLTGPDLTGPDAGAGHWSLGTVASPMALCGGPATIGLPADSGPVVLQPLTAMEREHLLTRAAEPYRDPHGNATAAAIQAARVERQQHHPGESTSAWRRRWRLSGRG